MCGGVAAGSSEKSGSRSRIAAITSDDVSPSKARRPVSISYSTQPNAQMSVRLSTALPRACSGDMYGAVPSSTPSTVGAIIVGELVSSFRPRRSPAPGFREPEVEHLHDAVRRERDVRRLQIAVDDAALVRRIERVRDLPRDRQRFVEPDALGPLPFELLRQRLSLDQLQHQRMDVAFVLEPVDGADVRVIQRREHFGFTQT